MLLLGLSTNVSCAIFEARTWFFLSLSFFYAFRAVEVGNGLAMVYGKVFHQIRGLRGLNTLICHDMSKVPHKEYCLEIPRTLLDGIVQRAWNSCILHYACFSGSLAPS